MKYKVYTRTRGFRTDYQWVGEQPEEWWRGHPAAGIVVNQKGILRVGDNWLLTGMPTGKEDSIGTPITSDLAIMPDATGQMSDAELTTLINQNCPNWQNSPNTLITKDYTVNSPLLTPEVRAELQSQSSRDSATPQSSAQNDTSRHSAQGAIATPPQNLANVKPSGGGCLVGLTTFATAVAIPSLVILRGAEWRSRRISATSTLVGQ